MTLRRLEESGLVPASESRRERPESVTVAFALDSGYLECFKVMLGSMVLADTLLDAPIAVYSDDPAVFDDPIVRLVADKTSLLSGERKEVIYRLARDNVRRPERSDWNRGTFLKWSVFEEQETDQLLFLDVDMICLGKLEPMLGLHKEATLLAGPQFQNYLRDGEEGVEPKLRELLDEQFDKMHSWRLNSGVMLIRKAFLNDAFFREITEFASQRKELHEQGHLSAYFAEHPEKLAMTTVKYNFQDFFLWTASRDNQIELLKDIAVLHYAGKHKPWRMLPKLNNRFSCLLWHSMRTYSGKILEYTDSTQRSSVTSRIINRLFGRRAVIDEGANA